MSYNTSSMDWLGWSLMEVETLSLQYRSLHTLASESFPDVKEGGHRRGSWKCTSYAIINSSSFRPQNDTKIGLRLARILAPNHSVTSIVRNKEHDADVRAASATPLILDLESSPTSEFSLAFDGAHVVYFSAGAGENASDERTKKVDYEGALKVFDAIERVEGPKPRLILVSTFDANDP